MPNRSMALASCFATRAASMRRKEYLRRAIEAVESQTARLGGSEERRSQFRAGFAALYRDEVEILLAQRRDADAFQMLERSRARSLLEMLAERDLVFTADISPELRDARQRNAAEYDQAQARLAKLNTADQGAHAASLRTRLRDLDTQREEIGARIRRASPRLAALQYPQPLDLPGTRRCLDAGTRSSGVFGTSEGEQPLRYKSGRN